MTARVTTNHDDTEDDLPGRLQKTRRSIALRVGQPPVDVGASDLNIQPVHSVEH